MKLDIKVQISVISPKWQGVIKISSGLFKKLKGFGVLAFNLHFFPYPDPTAPKTTDQTFETVSFFTTVERHRKYVTRDQ